MKEYILNALSSDKVTRYEVVVSVKSQDDVKISCDCPATVFCKHKAALINGDAVSIFPSAINELSQVEGAVNALKSSGIAEQYSSLKNELEKITLSFKKEEKSLKRKINTLGE